MLLDGVGVLDLTQFLPGGYCTRVLADLGATVTKVEVSTRGDPIRSLPIGEAYFEALHHGKPVVQLSLKTGVQTAAPAGGMLAVIAVVGAVVERQRTGLGRRLALTMTDVAKTWLVL